MAFQAVRDRQEILDPLDLPAQVDLSVNQATKELKVCLGFKVQLVLQDQLGLQGTEVFQEIVDLQAIVDHQEQLVLPVTRGFQVLKDLKGLLAHWVRLDHRVIREHLVHRGVQEEMLNQAYRELQVPPVNPEIEDCPVQVVNLVQLVNLGIMVYLDHQELLVCQEMLVLQDHLASLEMPEIQVQLVPLDLLGQQATKVTLALKVILGQLAQLVQKVIKVQQVHKAPKAHLVLLDQLDR